MPNYRRAWHPGGTYFFTVNLLERSGNALLVKHIDALKHGLVKRVADWPYSTYHRLVAAGIYSDDWAGGEETILAYDKDPCGSIRLWLLSR